jgi:RNA polymerase-binding protein DksA
MSQADLEHFRQMLLDLHRRLKGDVSHLTDEALRPGNETSGNLSNAPLHPADLGSETYQQELSLSLLENSEQVLEDIAAALERIHQGKYGRCDECGAAIPKARLQAVPYARHCVACARKLEQST